MEDMEKFEQTLKEIAMKEFTPERLEESSKKAYSEDRQYPENFSNWYTHWIGYTKLDKKDKDMLK